VTDIRATTELARMLVGVSPVPSKFWVRGNLPSGPGVAIVGTRRCTEYGRTIARKLGHYVAAAGWPVVSGLARGIDAAAHAGTVDGGGQGFAILGCGVDIIYPVDNRGLAGRLLASGGGLISEYPPGTPPAPFRFPARNRIIAGLSAAVVVVEAPVTGGALITARLALDQGKDVLAVPGDIGRATSEGCNLLIRDGAHPVLSGEDLIESLERILGPSPIGGSPIEIESNGVLLDEALQRSDRPVGAVLADVVRAELAGRLKTRDGAADS
jgi:DNA processing protein